MRKVHALMIILVLFLGTALVVPGKITKIHQSNEQAQLLTPSIETDLAADSIASDSLNVQTRNWDFEESDADGGPADWTYSGSAFSRGDVTYQDLVANGSYAGRLQARGSKQSETNSYIAQYQSTGFIDESPELEFWWYTVSAPDLAAGGYSYAQVQLNNGSNYFLYYYLTVGSSYLSNTSSRTCYFLNDSALQWNHFTQNILDDFNARSGWSAASNLELLQLTFYIRSPQDASGMSEYVIDDVSITNSTAYDYLLTRNGNFELGNGVYWDNYVQNEDSYVTLTEEATNGDKALNLTTANLIDNSQCTTNIWQYLGYPYGILPHAPDILLLDFDWCYSDTLYGDSQYAYLNVVFDNDTYWSNVQIFLGNNMNWSLSANYTASGYSYYYIEGPGFGSRDVWNHFHLDIYDLAMDLGFYDIGVTNVGLVVESRGLAGAVTTLLVDAFRVLCYPTGFAGFESETDGRISGNPIPGWYRQGSDSYYNHTMDSRSGNRAANITVTSGTSGALYRDIYTQLDSSSFIDFWWRIDDFTSTSSGYSYLELRLEGSYYVRYYLAFDTHSSVLNDSLHVYYMLPELNTTSIWIHTARNLTQDLESAFGANTWNVDQLWLYVYADVSGRSSILFDDVTITDAVDPTVSLAPINSVYYSPTSIEIDATDNRAGVRDVEFSYNSGSGWIHQIPVDMVSYYEMIIPLLPWNTTVEYYIIVTDYANRTLLYNNGGLNYSFRIGDDIAPSIEMTGINNGATVSRILSLNVSSSDEGGGVDFVELQVDSIAISQDYTSPYQFTLNTWILTNETHNVTTVSYDHNGNFASETAIVVVQNDVASPIISGVILNPSAPSYDQTTNIYVGVYDASGITNVTIYFRIDGDGFYQESMQSLGGSLYRFWTDLDYGVLYEYYIVAYDTTPFEYSESLGSEASPLSFTVGDSVAPILGVLGPASEVVRGTVQFSISAIDAGSGISSIEFLVDGTLVSTITASASIDWNTLEYENGDHTLTFMAIDNAGNEATLDLEFEVANPQGLDAIVDTLSSFMTSYGFFIGAGTMIGLFIIGKVLMNRRSASAAVSGTKSKAKKKK